MMLFNEWLIQQDEYVQGLDYEYQYDMYVDYLNLDLDLVYEDVDGILNEA